MVHSLQGKYSAFLEGNTTFGLRFPGGISGTEHSCQNRKHKRHRFNPWVRRIPWRRAWQPTAVFLLGESHGEEPGRLQSMGLQRVRPNCSDLARICTALGLMWGLRPKVISQLSVLIWRQKRRVRDWGREREGQGPPGHEGMEPLPKISNLPRTFRKGLVCLMSYKYTEAAGFGV